MQAATERSVEKIGTGARSCSVARVVDLTVIIPAHNEEAVIASCLDSLAAWRRGSDLRVAIIVVCNGCADQTATVARKTGAADVIEIGTASKVLGIDLGLSKAAPGPVMVMDADVRLRGAGPEALLGALHHPEVFAAAPVAEMDYSSGASWAVRAFYRLWFSLPYVNEGMVGCGVYVLSEAARERIGLLPEVIADDGFVRACFAPAERCRVDDVVAVVRAPRTLRDLIRIKTRSRLGSYQLARLHDSRIATVPKTRRGHVWLGILLSPWLWPCLAVYVFVNLVGRWRARRQLMNRLDTYVWERDESTRVAAVATSGKRHTL